MSDAEQHVSKRHRWKPGESGNPKGRAKKTQTITEALRRMGEEIIDVVAPTGEHIQVRRIDYLATVLWDEATRKRDLRAAREIIDRCEGKAQEHIEVSGANGGPVVTVIEVHHYGNGDSDSG